MRRHGGEATHPRRCATRAGRWSRWFGGAWLAFAVLVPGQATERAIELQSFTPDQGVALAANVLLRDRDGVLWVGSDRGLFRFDGRGFVAVASDIDPLALQVNDLYQSPSGRLWVGAARHVYVWERGRLRRVADLPVSDLRRLAGDGGEGVYVRHQHQLWHVRADGAVQAVDWPAALSVGALTDGPLLRAGPRLWTSCNPGLCERVAGAGRRWGEADGVPSDHWNTLQVSADGDLWVGGNRHLLHLPAGAQRFEAIASAHPIDALDVDGAGRVLAASDGRIYRWDGHDWQAFSDAQVLQQAQIRDLAFDPAGAVWLATAGRGVMRWRGYGRFRNWTVAQGLDSAPTWALARDADGRLWIGNQRFGNLLEPGADRLAPWPQAMRDGGWTDAIALLPRDRQMWVLFNEGRLVRYDLDTQRAQPVASGLGWSKFALFDPAGRLWIGIHGTLWRIDHPAAAQPVATAVGTGLPPDTNYLGGTVDAEGRLWLATSRGLLRDDGDRLVVVGLDGPVRDGGLVDVAVDGEGVLWLAQAAGGLLQARPGEGNTLAVGKAGDALLDRTVPYSLEVDRHGRLWVLHGAGVDVHARGHWRRLDRADGLVWDDLSTGGFFADADGSLWFGTSGGLSHLLHPQRLAPVPPPAPIWLEVQYGSTRIAPGGAPSLRWSGQSLGVAVARTDTAHPTSQWLEYRVHKDHDPAPVERTQGQAVRLAALAPGQYRFEARFVDPDLRAASAWAGFELTLVPPWWRSRLARLGYGVLALVLVAGLWRWRNARLLRRQAKLERLVRERTLALENDKRALEAARTALQYEASHDALTGLLNRGAVVEALMDALLDAAPERRTLAVALLDLDHFKRINDTHGHLTGDAVLVQFAERLRALAPPGVLLGRYGGEEMLAVWPGLACDIDLARLFAPLIRGEYRDGDTWLQVSCSIGVTWWRPTDDLHSLLRRADAALYQAKDEGRARVVRQD